MSKNIIIIGGGISGLSVLHYLKIKYLNREDIQIRLYEKNEHVGGTIHTLTEQGCLFETGPNGFLDNKPRTLHLAQELNLEGRIQKADEQSKIRYILKNGALREVPTDPKAFLTSKLLGPLDKIRVAREMSIPKGGSADETIASFGKRRFGDNFTRTVIDSVVNGIFAGDIEQLNLQESFPRVFELEQEYGSLFKAMKQIKKKNETETQSAGKPTLTSFQGGMSELISALASEHKDAIQANVEIESITEEFNQYIVHTAEDHHPADEVYVCTPAYAATELVKRVNSDLSGALSEVQYVPIVLVGLLYNQDVFTNLPKGFGYLVPSKEAKEVLGVLFESNIFPTRCSHNQFLFRVMLGGAHHPEILKLGQETLIDLAAEEIQDRFQMEEPAEHAFYKAWARAIPQYDQSYVKIKPLIQSEVVKTPRIHLVANYLNGISMNDCIENAFQAANESDL